MTPTGNSVNAERVRAIAAAQGPFASLYVDDTRNSADERLHHDGRRPLCAAEGVLVALQQCSLDDALLDIVETARRYNVAPLSLATALISRAQGNHEPKRDEAVDGAIDETWGELLTRSPVSVPAGS